MSPRKTTVKKPVPASASQANRTSSPAADAFDGDVLHASASSGSTGEGSSAATTAVKAKTPALKRSSKKSASSNSSKSSGAYLDTLTALDVDSALCEELPCDEGLEDEAPSEDLTSFEDSELEGLLSSSASGGKNSSGRKPITPPAVIKPGMNLYEYLCQCTPPLDKKLIDIACSKSNIFGELRKDVAQEVMLVWSFYVPNTEKFKPGQIASYAHRIAGHTALRVRRDLGSAVRLPGSAFRARADGSSYVTPGVLAQALDWNDIENWMLLDGAEPGMNGISSLSLEVEGVVKHLEESVDATSEADAEEASRSTRLQNLETNKSRLTERQYAILKSMIEGSRIDEIMEEHHIKKGLLLREIHIAMELMWAPT